jgi:hypothetical protein
LGEAGVFTQPESVSGNATANRVRLAAIGKMFIMFIGKSSVYRQQTDDFRDDGARNRRRS